MYGNYFFAFNPCAALDKEKYERYIRLLTTIYDVLNEFHISAKCKGYTFMKDAICIIIDLQRMDICFEKEIYKQIAKKYNASGADAIEHGIRNALNGAKIRYGGVPNGMTNKPFLLMAAQEVSSRLLKELCA